MDRVVFVIDGFNLYHSVCDANVALGGASTKWLDIKKLCCSYLHLLGKDAALEDIYYFSALAKHLEPTKPDVTKRHRDFLRCLEATGIKTELNRFKRKDTLCPHCRKNFDKYEEKETDVAIAVKLMELLILGSCDTVVLMTGDTDLAPAIRLTNQLFPLKRIVFAFPYLRKNRELALLAPGSWSINRKQYAKHQFPDPFVLPDGDEIKKPALW